MAERIDLAPKPEQAPVPMPETETKPALEAAGETTPVWNKPEAKPSATQVSEASEKAKNLAKTVGFGALSLGAAGATKAAKAGYTGLDAFLHKLEQWGEKNAKRLGEIPVVGGAIVWTLEKLKVIGKGGGGHEKKEEKKHDGGHGKKDDHGKKGGGHH
ncbi:hypothetical protein A2856_03805 [Candidatus Uhrbacteria bacterium RIFCSPHIGHO2_01_FULL_63_20]|uniref:Uncharacterized protein n=1 Tax=Candidatus Uhrbacteria bacterium RIFCSPHIGHO2_01_FULL_63_20 TaxID=1802385 RepID=A0A1F7TMF1_9BACT|nr:MAG: hypothetical protein A2856_03805 [Candidatus Uhrbacteria bacterium RIFCSPHIGHO2_01_FULL_63_20]